MGEVGGLEEQMVSTVTAEPYVSHLLIHRDSFIG